MYTSYYEFYDNFHNVKDVQLCFFIQIEYNIPWNDIFFISYKFKSWVCLCKSIGLWQNNNNKNTSEPKLKYS